jgi:hypothetical protein
MLTLANRLLNSGGAGGLAFVDAYANSEDDVTNMVAQLSGLQTGDLLVYCLGDNWTSKSMSTPSGWSTLIDYSNFGIKARVMTKAYSPGDDVDGQDCDFAGIIAFREGGTVTDEGRAGTFGSSVTPEDANVLTNGSAVLLFTFQEANATISTTPSGYTVQAQSASSSGAGAILSKEDVPSGTESPGTVGWSSGSSMSVWTILINPA